MLQVHFNIKDNCWDCKSLQYILPTLNKNKISFFYRLTFITFRLMVDTEQKFQSLPYVPCLYQPQPPSMLIFLITEQVIYCNEWFTWIHHHEAKSKLYVVVHTWGRLFYGFGQIHKGTCIIHGCFPIQRHFCLTWSLPTTNCFTDSVVLLFWNVIQLVQIALYSALDKFY